MSEDQCETLLKYLLGELRTVLRIESVQTVKHILKDTVNKIEEWLKENE